MNDWQAFEAEMGRIISAETEKPFTPETIAQARDFLAAVRDRCPIPEVGKGYWSTIIFDWGLLQIEIFGDRLELYRFFDRRTEIRHVSHRLGEPFPPELMSELPTL